MKIVIMVLVALAVCGIAYADSLQQVTLPSGQNCQVQTIAGQTYVNC